MKSPFLITAVSGAVALVALLSNVLADNAPNAPGSQSVWAPAAKDFLGTSVSKNSSVHFTGAEGILTEVFYPSVDAAQNVDLQLLIVDKAGTFSGPDAEERKQTKHNVTLVDKRSMVWQVVTTANNGKWKTTKKFFADPKRSSVIERVTFETLESGKSVNDYNVYVLNNPAINNTGGGQNFPGGTQDNSRTITSNGRTFVAASEPNSTSSALGISRPWAKANGGAPLLSSGFVGSNDGYTDLFGGSHDHKMDWQFTGAFQGNVAQMGLVDFEGSTDKSITFDIVLGFGKSEDEAMSVASGTLSDDLGALEQQYTTEWKGYCSGLNALNGRADDQYYLAAMVLKTAQDKSNGAMVAGLGTPWGETNNDSNYGGYHLIWARDLFKFASALLAAGDKDSANKAVEFLFNVQMQTETKDSPYSRPGRFPQNTQANGTPYWNGQQMDEVAMPIILAWKLNRVDLYSKIKLAAEFLAHNGPVTGQERWEEMGGYSPSTIAAEIAGLVCAASLADKANDPGAAAFYRAKADEWRNSVPVWTFTTAGILPNNVSNGKYYIRITQSGNPNDDVSLVFGNGVGSHGQRYIIDGGFLELVRMGVLSPSDWTILETMPEYDAVLKQTFAGGDAFFRYNYDGYGESNTGANYDGRTGRGRLWPIFTAERGIYEISKSGQGTKGQPYAAALKTFSTPVGMIPEQIFNTTANITGWQTTTPDPYKPEASTKSMRPLNWAMGEYINLLVAMENGKNDAPKAVVDRYKTDKPQTNLTFEVNNADTVFGEEIYLVGSDPLLGGSVAKSGVKMTFVSTGKWSVTISLPANTNFDYHFAKLRGGDEMDWAKGAPSRSVTSGAAGSNATKSDSL